MKFYYVYMVECSDESIYTGLTNNLDRRLKEHNFGRNDNSYTSKRRPVKLIWHQEFMQFAQAEYFEKKIKRWSCAKKLALANDEYDMLPLLAECRNESHAKNKDLDKN
ncbi:GIY-YIG nuclease family protein [Maribacter algarum]|nr:GIY-YIG nuclease family protein [Maribacter algarum]